MQIKILGEAVRQRRKELGVSQGMVCDGLCTAMTLSRFESGRQTPSWDCTTAILQRLGLPDGRYYAQLTRSETRLVFLRKEVLAWFSRFEHTLGEERRLARANTVEKLRELECCIKADDRIDRQFILGIRAALGSSEGPYPTQKRLSMLMEAIHLTSPRFDLDKIENFLYSSNEVAIINKIAVSYARGGQRTSAIRICGQILKLLQKRTPDHSYLPLIAYNYSQYLASEKRFEEALEIAGLGRQACLKQEHYLYLPGFLHIEAECYYFLGDMGRSEELYRSAYYLYGATKNKNNQEVLISEAEERLHLSF